MKDDGKFDQNKKLSMFPEIEIEFQKFKGIIKSKKDETMYLKKFYI